MTPRQETFCQYFVANGGNGTQAAIAAGYAKESASQQSRRMLSYEQVATRIAGLRGRAAKRSEVTMESLAADFERIYEGAVALGQMAAAVSAKEKIAKLYGLMSDRVFVHEVQKLSDAELIERIAGDDPAKRIAAQRLLSSPDSFPSDVKDA